MATGTRALTLKLLADVDNFTKNLNKADNDVSTFGDKVSDFGKKAGLAFAAAGNTGVEADTLSPVGLDTVIGVAASDAYDRVISWGSGLSSNWGPEVDLTAPGVDVPIINLNGGYTTGSGTSIAAAIVSGVVAQYIKNNNSLTAQQIQNLVT